MQIILLDKVVNLGNLGDIVKVKDGYARNFLIPSGRARRATEQAKAEFLFRLLMRLMTLSLTIFSLSLSTASLSSLTMTDKTNSPLELKTFSLAARNSTVIDRRSGSNPISS